MLPGGPGDGGDGCHCRCMKTFFYLKSLLMMIQNVNSLSEQSPKIFITKHIHIARNYLVCLVYYPISGSELSQSLNVHFEQYRKINTLA